MNFFKSVFADETPDSPPSSDPQSSETLISDTSSPDATSPLQSATPKSPFSAAAAGFGGGGWSFGGLIQTISSKSESVLETYRRDLQEFSTGLKNETQVLKSVAATSLDVGAAKAQVSLESVGQAFDSFGSVVSEFILHGGDQHGADQSSSSPSASSENQSLLSRDVGVKYSRFEAQLRAIQTDEITYVEEPAEDGGEGGEFEKWKAGFDLAEQSEEVDDLLGRRESGVEAIYKRVVPSVVDRETFWLRYFYRVHRLKQAEFVRARLVKRAIAADDEEEELSWDVEDDDDVEQKDADSSVATNASVKEEKSESEGAVGVEVVENRLVEDNVEVERNAEEETVKKDEAKQGGVVDAVVEGGKDEAKQGGGDDIVVGKDEAKQGGGDDVMEGKDEAKQGGGGDDVVEGKGEASGSSKDSDFSVVSSQPSSHEEEDLGWDEIEDVGSDNDEKDGTTQLGSSPNRAELRKRLSAAEDDEDLSWDIEDDDEPIKH